MIEANNLRKGVTFKIDEDIFKVNDYSHNKPGRGLATIRVKSGQFTHRSQCGKNVQL